MTTILNYLMGAFLAIDQMCYAWSGATVAAWETFTEYYSGILNTGMDWYYTLEALASPIVRWLVAMP